ncbi:MAG: hypothetical protein ACI9KE_000705 [Polyangiales bacterium]
MARELQELFDEFAKDFMAPLLQGGETQAVRVMPPHVLENFGHGAFSDTDVELQIREGLSDAVADLATSSVMPFPEPNAMAVVLAGHNLIALTDPKLDRRFARGSRSKVLVWADEIIDSIGAPTTRGEALTRHALLSRLLDLTREDTILRSWAYTYRFHGRAPTVKPVPPFDFLDKKTSRVTMRRLLRAQDEPIVAATNRLIARSPITLLLEHKDIPDMRFGEAVVSVLSDPGLRQGIIQSIVRSGTQHVAAPFGRALRHFAAMDPPGEYILPVVAFLAELQILEVLDDRAGHRPKDVPAIGDEELFSAVLPALFESEGAAHSLIQLEKSDYERVRARAEQRKLEAGDDAVEMARSIAQRAIAASGARTS